MKAQRLSSDRITTLPPTIIENILCLLPIKEAARTSILSRDWRYTWTKIPKLIFNEKDIFAESTVENECWSIFKQVFREEVTQTRKLFYAIHQVLLLNQGPIVEFSLSMKADHSCIEIDQILLHLSRKNTVKKLQLSCSYELPLCVFSFHQLTDLDLHDCAIYHPPTFNGFGSLKNLRLEYVHISKKALMNILYNSPLLRSFTMVTSHYNILNDYDSTILDLFKCLPVIEHFTFCVWDIECFGEGEVPQKLPASLVHLSYICLRMCFHENSWLDFLSLLIRSSPNLEKLEILTHCEVHLDYNYWEQDIYSFTLPDHPDIRLEHLIEFKIGNHIRYWKLDNHMNNLKPELELVKLILAKSPVLKKVNIVLKKVNIMLSDEFTKDDELEILSLLLSSPPKSPLVKIYLDIYVPCRRNWPQTTA